MVIEALERAGGCQAIAARALNVSRVTMYRYLQRWPVLKELIEEQTELRLDEAEVALRSAVLKGEAWAVCFFLKTRGKQRGYVERTEHQHEMQGPPFKVYVGFDPAKEL